MTTILLVAAVVNLFLSVLVANMGSKRKLGGLGAFFLSFFFSPILGMLFVIASERLTAEEIERRKEGSESLKRNSLAFGLVVAMIVLLILVYFKL
jgi:Na+-driven multidrug efflux pump